MTSLRSAEPDADAESLQQADFTRWIERLPKPVGLLGFGDAIAAKYCQWSLDAGLRVPEDVAIIGINDFELICESAEVPLSSIAFDHDAVAHAAIGLLDQLMAGRSVECTTVMVPPRCVVTRQSSDVWAASDPAVVGALRFMWDHIDQDLSVDQIVDHVGVSRRTLERAFRRELDRGIGQEFQRRKLQKAKTLLDETDLKVAQIAQALGFRSRNYFFEAFRNAYETSPSAYRNRDS